MRRRGEFPTHGKTTESFLNPETFSGAKGSAWRRYRFSQRLRILFSYFLINMFFLQKTEFFSKKSEEIQNFRNSLWFLCCFPNIFRFIRKKN